MSCNGTSKTYNFSLDRGSTKVLTINYTDSAGDIIPLTNYSARMFLRTTPTTTTTALELYSSASTANKSILAITEPSGSIGVYISAADTILLTENVYFYDLEIFTTIDPYTKSDPEYVQRLLEGTITTKYNITK